MFVVVQFTNDDKAYNVVPMTWYDGALVTWHKSTVFAKSAKAPLKTWPKYAAKLADTRQFPTYEEAEERMDEIIYQQTESEAEIPIPQTPTPFVPPKRIALKRKHEDFVYSSDNGEIEDPVADFDEVSPEKLMCSPDLQKQSSADPIAADVDYTFDTNCGVLQSSAVDVQYTVTSNNDVLELLRLVKELAASSKEQKLLIERQNELNEQQNVELCLVKTQLNIVSSELRKVKVALRGVDAPLPVQSVVEQKFGQVLPINTYDELMTFESTMDRAEVSEFLGRIGGKTAQKMIANLASAVFTSDLQVATTWKGKRAQDGGWAKPPLMTAATPSMIVSVVQTAFPKNTMDEVLTMLQKYLQHATDRARKMAKE